MTEKLNQMMNSLAAETYVVVEASEFIEKRLYYIVISYDNFRNHQQSFKDWKTSQNEDNIFYLTAFDDLISGGFSSNLGTFNLGLIYRFVFIVRDCLKRFKKVVYCAHKANENKQDISSLLMCAYMIIEENWTASQAYELIPRQFRHRHKIYKSNLDPHFSILVEECLNALYKAKWYGFFDFANFNVWEYDKYKTSGFGGINWIVPETLLAFETPLSQENIDKNIYKRNSNLIKCRPDQYFQYFKENNVKHVVRLNETDTYDGKYTFEAVAKIKHTDLYFEDGTPPPDTILESFLSLCEQYISKGSKAECLNNVTKESKLEHKNENKKINALEVESAVAVHCLAGLGRTGSLIASYIVKHWSFTAVEAASWIRICRPKSLNICQLNWLIKKEEYLKTTGAEWRKKKNLVDKFIHFTNGIYSFKQPTSIPNIQYVDPPLETNFSKECQKSYIP